MRPWQTKLLLSASPSALLAHLLLHADEAPRGRVLPHVKFDLPLHKGKQRMVFALQPTHQPFSNLAGHIMVLPLALACVSQHHLALPASAG